MKALLICSVRSLFPITPLEVQACNRAFAKANLDLAWTLIEVAKVQAAGTLPNALVAIGERVGATSLHADYLDALNELIWDASPDAFDTIRIAIDRALELGLQRGFVSEYPLLTTNLARSAALRTHATRLGEVCVPKTHDVPFDPKAALEDLARRLNVAPQDCEVLVASQRDLHAAQTAGMSATLVQGASLHAPAQPAGDWSRPLTQTRASAHTCVS